MLPLDATATVLLRDKDHDCPAYVMKFDPSKRTIKRASENIHLLPNLEKSNPFEVTEVVDNNCTATTFNVSIPSLISEMITFMGTAADQRQIWPTLPKFFDYMDVEALYDADEIDELFLQAAGRQGW